MADNDTILDIVPRCSKSLSALDHRENAGRAIKRLVDGRPERAFRLCLLYPPKDPEEGFEFGTDKDHDDIVIKAPGIDAPQFVINVNHLGLPYIQAVRGQLEVGNLSLSGHSDEMAIITQHADLRFCGLTFLLTIPDRKPLSTYEDHLEAYNNSIMRSVFGATGHINGAPISPREEVGQLLKLDDIGGGRSGNVMLLVDSRSGATFAAKKGDESIDREVKILKQLEHENIVGFFGRLSRKQSCYLLMEHIPEGNLLRNIERCEFLDPLWIAGVLHQCLAGLDYIHSKGIIHCDIKPDNILVESYFPFIIKLADFESAKSIGDPEREDGTKIYYAPERLDGRSYDGLVDIWALGLVILELCGVFPRKESWDLIKDESTVNKEAYIAAILRGVKRLPKKIALFLGRMLEVDPRKRWPAKKCLEGIEEFRGYMHDRQTREAIENEQKNSVSPTVTGRISKLIGLLLGFAAGQ